MYLDDPFRTRFSYTDYLQLGLAYDPDAKKVLVIGLGGGRPCRSACGATSATSGVTTVELDPDVVDAAYRWFALPRDPPAPGRWSTTAAASCSAPTSAST